jgi:hypothetical protein
MMRLDDHLSLLDPVDPRDHEPDGELLLRGIVSRPVPAARAPRRVRRPRLVLVGATCAAVGVVALAMPRGTPVNVVAKAYDAVTQPNTILHYRMHWTAPRQDLGVVEAWQASDGSRTRTLSTFPGAGESEEVASAAGTRTWLAGDNTIVTYDGEHAGPPPAPGTAAVRRDVGDPSTLLRRAQAGDAQVTELGEATVRGIPVLQFRVGRCVVRRNAVTFPSVVSVRRDDYTPVRVQDAPCPEAGGATGMTIDYDSFDVLPATDANRRLLDMDSHPGAKEVDGAAVDAAEERESRRPRRLRLLDLQKTGRARFSGR